MEIGLVGQPEPGHARVRDLLEQRLELEVSLIQDDEALAALVVGHARDDERGIEDAERLVQALLDLHMRDHLAADLREAREPVSQHDEAVLVDPGDVARDVVAVLDHVGCPRVVAEVAFHDVRALHEQQARGVRAELRARLGIDDLHEHAGQRLADGAELRAGLVDAGPFDVGDVERGDGGQLGRAVAFERGDFIFFQKGFGDFGTQFFGADHD